LSSNSSNLESYFLPAPSAHFIKRISFVQPNKTIRYLIEELFEDYIYNESFLMLYGDKLMKFFIENDKDVQLRKLCNRCVKLVFECNEYPPNVQLFRIISKSLAKINERNPTFIDDFIIRISFLCVFDNSYLEATLEQKIRLKHLHHYGSYSKLSKLTYIDSLMDRFYGFILHCKILNNNFYQVHVSKVHELIRHINSKDWNKHAKPIISNPVKDVLKVFDNEIDEDYEAKTKKEGLDQKLQKTESEKKS
ncbi:33052_t:CDS:2, partial [Gigaspora margarita]